MGLHPQNIGATMPHGFAGGYARQPDMIVNTRPAGAQIVFGTALKYASWVYAARVTAAMLSVQGVINVTGLTINGSVADLQLTEDGLLQQVPVLGEVTVNA